MLKIAAKSQVFKRHEISDREFVRSVDNIADGLDKSMNHGKIRACLSGTLQVVP